jgi:hypothetical protein
MGSFVPKLNALKIRLEGNAALQAYAADTFGKQFMVKRVFKRRVEVHTNDLPLVLMTRPSVSRTISNGVITKEHVVRLYIGFTQNDLEKAQDNLIELDELIDTAVMEKTALTGDLPMPVSPQGSDNDEGVYHPTYFLVKDLMVKER